MKTKSSKQPKQTQPAVQLKDLTTKKNPKGGAGGGAWKTGLNQNHNETFVWDVGA